MPSQRLKNNEKRNIKINLRCYTQKKRGKLQNKRLQQVEPKDLFFKTADIKIEFTIPKILKYLSFMYKTSNLLNNEERTQKKKLSLN